MEVILVFKDGILKLTCNRFRQKKNSGFGGGDVF